MGAFGDFAVLKDNFNRGTGLGSNWSVLTSGGTNLSISSNQAISPVSTTANSYWNVEDFGPNMEAYVTITTLPGNGNRIAVHGRVTSPGTSSLASYWVSYDPAAGGNNIVIYKFQNGVISTLATFAQTLSAGDKVGVRILGSLIEAWVFTSGAWTLVGSITDTSLGVAVGKAALLMRGTAGRADDFFAGTIKSLAPPPFTQARRCLLTR